MEKNLQYPIGRYTQPAVIDEPMLASAIEAIELFPARLNEEVCRMTDDQLDTPYRPGGWTVRQLIHHCADSHMNSFIRLKLALTEENPVIKPYKEERWAMLADSKLEIESSIKLLEALHFKWAFLLKALTYSEREKCYTHPESGKEFDVAQSTLLYGWHCAHHLAHITELKNRNGWVN